MQLHYYLTVGKAYLAQRDRRTLAKISEQGHGFGFKPDINKKQLSAKITAFKIINITQFFDSEAEFTKDDLADWLKLVIDCRFDLQAILGVLVNPEKDSAIAVAQRFLRKLGQKLQFKCWRGSRSSKQRVYSGCGLNSDERASIFDCWSEREQQFV